MAPEGTANACKASQLRHGPARPDLKARAAPCDLLTEEREQEYRERYKVPYRHEPERAGASFKGSLHGRFQHDSCANRHHDGENAKNPPPNHGHPRQCDWDGIGDERSEMLERP